MTFSEGSPFHIIVTSYQLVRIPSFPLPSSPFLFACLSFQTLPDHLVHLSSPFASFRIASSMGQQLTTRRYKMRNTSRG